MDIATMLAGMAMGQVATPCDTSAHAFVDGSPRGRLPVSTTLVVGGEGGDQSYMFTSGTLLSMVQLAVNAHTWHTGVHAEPAADNSMRIMLASSHAGASAFVSVSQVGGDVPRLYAVSVGGTGVWRLIAHGESGFPGDADCDGRVDIGDINLVIDHWGACPPSPSACPGDVDLSGDVNIDDLLLVMAGWGGS